MRATSPSTTSTPGIPCSGSTRRPFPVSFGRLPPCRPVFGPHLRYPQDLFNVQVAKYARYHMTDPQVFYNKEDLWQIPKERYAGSTVPVEPYYMLVRLPGESRLEFMLMMPLTPANRDNMIAWMAARCDPDHYGQIVVFKLPKERLILGPTQIEATIDQDTTISRSSRSGTSTARGWSAATSSSSPSTTAFCMSSRSICGPRATTSRSSSG